MKKILKTMEFITCSISVAFWSWILISWIEHLSVDIFNPVYSDWNFFVVFVDFLERV